jgi:predicted acylesterase/phospholipase RssA
VGVAKGVARRLRTALALALVLLVAGCATRPVPVPPEERGKALPWGAIDPQTHDIEADARASREARQNDPNGDYRGPDGRQRYAVLALSGGGSRGAYGAGLLAGWSKRGDRPRFKVVTGVSTGALMSTLVFLGPKYDTELERFYTRTTNADVYSGPDWLSGLFGISIMDTAALRRTLRASLTDEMIDAVAAEYRVGRRLYVATTNLDDNRFVVWDMGAIAASARPDRYDRYREVLLASASIPIAFPPVYFPVEVNGTRYWQMHVDGGVAANIVFAKFMLEVQAAIERDVIAGRKPQVDFYAILNGPMEPAPLGDAIDPNLFALASASMWTTSWAAQIMQLAMLYLGAQQRGIGYHITGIPPDYKDAPEVANFDPDRMTKLFRFGEEQGRSGAPWKSRPPLIIQPKEGE